MQCLILPDLPRVVWKDVGLDDEAKTAFPADKANPLADPIFQEKWLEELRRRYKCDHTVGGYLEDRSHLWRGFEESGYMIHLGIDLNNLPVGSPVAIPRKGKVVHVFHCTKKWNGWGGRVIVQLDQPHGKGTHLLYGHLDPGTLPKIGQTFEAGEIVGKLGNGTNNGGWFEHLHVQLNTSEFMRKYADNLEALDGYALSPQEAAIASADWVVDPTELVFEIEEAA
ncbi:hypothetical protein HDU85_000901 [Gaertneriomyces sp. JEL0708]|nr:hypothetical protein HDU85_000901 [Gaertneriomyces sp. JEL0708]